MNSIHSCKSEILLAKLVYFVVVYHVLYPAIPTFSYSWPKDQRIFHVCILYTHHAEVMISFDHGLKQI